MRETHVEIGNSVIMCARMPLACSIANVSKLVFDMSLFSGAP
jgi:hypothetical protein